ncbi:MAG TPA: J domain-containing protein [Vicinamibacterales bacterium]
MKNYYDLLSVNSSAPSAEIKRAFRQEIARYHPDKVQHLGKEFQEMAAVRAAELTEAYRILMNSELRAEYDRQLPLKIPSSPPPPAAAAPSVEAPVHKAPKVVAEPLRPPRDAPPQPARPASLFAEERSTKDEYVRKATLGRIRKIVTDELGSLIEVPVRGFDLVFTTQARSRLFGKRQSVPNFFVRLVRDVNSVAIRETWTMAQKARGAEAGEACIALLGPVTSVREVADAVSNLKQRSDRPSGSLLLVPVDIRDWSAQIPHNAPRICKVILERLKQN